ncbi:MAG: Flp pilus assembly complex ATPase component TadA [Phycisphaerales bacterium]|nr:Flp pilus assembly complex ATPase component TadA [Phycisphaerales bacterium]
MNKPKMNLDDLMQELGVEAPRTTDNSTETESINGFTGEVPAMFRRRDPELSPPPPDMAGDGLGQAISNTPMDDVADETRIRPDDAVEEFWRPDPIDESRSADLADRLVADGSIAPDIVETARRVLSQSPGRVLAEVLMEMGADQQVIQRIVAEESNLAFEDVTSENIDHSLFDRIGAEFCLKNRSLPLRQESNRVVVGTTRPDDVFVLDHVKSVLCVAAVKHVLITPQAVELIIEELGAGGHEEYDVEAILADVEDDDVEVIEQAEDEEEEDAQSSPVVRYVNHLIQTAVKEGASDIHIEPAEKAVKIRMRVDGILYEMMNPPRKMLASITSRLKIMAQLDIAERRLPQDGRIRVTVMGRQLDLRVSTIPTPHGEKTVMRVLDNRSIRVALNELGFDPVTLKSWESQISRPHGVILVTGPTGSGKTTTLYASLQQMDTTRLNVSTVEDPVEYQLQGITQIQTHERIGLTFAASLRALLRQDPDIVMVGEIRDHETATIAIQAALTGHLVLSTLHTNDAPSSITRLFNIGIEPFLVSGAVNGVLAQRLVRRICPDCREEIEISEQARSMMDQYGISCNELHHGAGCANCRASGYSGRLGIYEMLEMSDALRDSVASSPSVTEFRQQCLKEGMRSLRADALHKMVDGHTTMQEVLRVTDEG